MIDAKLFNYTFGAGELIEIVGQTSFRTIKIVEEATLVRIFYNFNLMNNFRM